MSRLRLPPAFTSPLRRPIRLAPPALPASIPRPLDVHARYRIPLRADSRIATGHVPAAVLQAKSGTLAHALLPKTRLASSPGLEQLDTKTSAKTIDETTSAPLPNAPAIPALPSRASGSVIQGVKIPPKPRAPGDEECCMSGCVHCVYMIYAEELEHYTEAIETAQSALIAAKVAEADWPPEVRKVNAQEKEGIDPVEAGKQEVVRDMDPTMAAFLALEGKLKQKQQANV